MDEAWRAKDTAQFGVVARMLPGLITTARAPTDRADALRLAIHLCVHLGAEDLSYLAADRAVTAAENADDLGLLLAAAQEVGWAYLAQGRAREALAYLTAVADANEPKADATREHVALWGDLLLTAGSAAGRAGADSGPLLEAAGHAADKAGDVRTHRHRSGRALVDMQRVDARILAGDYGRALEIPVRMTDVMSPLARLRHLSDRALAYTRTRQDDRAKATVFTIHKAAPEYLAIQPYPRATIAELAARERQGRTPFQSLAGRLGIAH